MSLTAAMLEHNAEPFQERGKTLIAWLAWIFPILRSAASTERLNFFTYLRKVVRARETEQSPDRLLGRPFFFLTPLPAPTPPPPPVHNEAAGAHAYSQALIGRVKDYSLTRLRSQRVDVVLKVEDTGQSLSEPHATVGKLQRVPQFLGRAVRCGPPVVHVDERDDEPGAPQSGFL